MVDGGRPGEAIHDLSAPDTPESAVPERRDELFEGPSPSGHPEQARDKNVQDTRMARPANVVTLSLSCRVYPSEIRSLE